VRLFAICISWLLISIPLQIYFIRQQASIPHVPFNWALVHDPESWTEIQKFPSNGTVIYVRYVWLISAFLVFVLFGFGRDASKMYARGLRAFGLGRCLPFLRLDQAASPARSTSQSGTINSVSSKAKLMFGRKGSSVKSWATDSRSSKATASSKAESLSLQTMKHLETVQESSRAPSTPAPVAGAFTSRLPTWLGGHRNAASDVEKNLPALPKQTGFQRLTSPFRPAVASREPAVPMNNIMRTQDVTIQTIATADRT